MNFILHKHQTENHVVPVPFGLKELLDDISREVLREQPDQIYEFIADYLDALLLIRETNSSIKCLFFISIIFFTLFFLFVLPHKSCITIFGHNI